MSVADDLAAGFTDEFGDVQIEVTDTDDGYSRLTVTWPDGAAAKLDVYPDHVDWKHLGHLRLMKPAHDAVRAVFPGLGLGHLFCAAADDRAREALLKNGDWRETTLPDGTPGLRWDLNGG